MPKRLSIIPVLLITVTGCFDTELVFENQYQAVVEAYLYVDKDTNNIALTSMISFGNDSTGGEKITDASVVLEHGNEIWELLHNDENPGNYFLNERLLMEPGDTFKLTVDLEDEILGATTVIPENPPLVSMSSSSIYIPKVEDMIEFLDFEMPDPIELTWDNPDLNYYFFRIQNIETYADAIMPDPPDNFPFEKDGFAFQKVTRPTNDNNHFISIEDLTHFGTHRIIVYSVNEEYVNLYNSLDQDTRELNEPYSNIENGLGIFTAFSSDTSMYFEVIPYYL